ncbi:acyl-CoA dehydrogenase family protein [Amorphus sp. 3PC139-8]|uniref:acyl-CoA dehydrogenase family protein n=1 Tax=Amorphus sp. 3PC139-8 TaxID=2735676 RepID=UPI00345CDB15
MDLALPDELSAFRDMLARFVDRELIPLETRLDEDGALPAAERAQVCEKAKQAGLWLLDLPQELGGAGLGALGMTLFWEEISRTTAVPARDQSIFGPAVGPILETLTGKLAEQYRDPTCRGEKTACFAQTEPDAGADPRSMRTRAVREGDDYVVNGVKRFITGADTADFAQVMVKTAGQGEGRDQITCLLIDMATEGVRIAAKHRTMMGDAPCEIVFENARVPVSNRVGEEGEGFKLAQRWINLGRLRHAARACGVARRCIEMTARYALERRTFGERLADRQAVQWALADSRTELHATQLMVRQAAWKIDQGEDIRLESYMLKLYGDEMGFRVADRCLQFHGGMGLTLDMPIQKLWRDQRSFMITEGPSEVMRMAIARQVLAESA